MWQIRQTSLIVRIPPIIIVVLGARRHAMGGVQLLVAARNSVARKGTAGVELKVFIKFIIIAVLHGHVLIIHVQLGGACIQLMYLRMRID